MVPDSWSLQNLAEVAAVLFSNVDKKSNNDETVVRLCNYTDVYYNTNITDDMEFMSGTATDAEIAKFALRKGDVVITKDSETPDDIAVPAYVSEDLNGVICGYHLAIIRPAPETLDGAFLAQLLQTHAVQHRFFTLANGVTRYGLTREATLRASLLLPPVFEQRQLVQILSRWDRAIDQVTNLIDAKTRLKRGLMQQLLTGKRRFPGSDGIPWRSVELRDVADINRHNLSEDTNDNYAFWYLDLSSVSRGQVSLPNEKIRFADSPSRARRLLKQGDVIMSTVRPNLEGFARADFDTTDFVCSTGFAVITPHDPEDSEFLYQSLYAPKTRAQLTGLTVGSNYPAVNSGDVEQLVVAYPSSSQDRKRVAEVLRALDSNVADLRSLAERLVIQKRGLMQVLLSGKVRVKTDMEASNA